MTNEAAEVSEGREPAPRRVGFASRIAMALIRGYQRLFAFRPSPCRFVPSCSNYALDAYEHRGFAAGTWLTVRRIARCNPWGGHGWDPVPGAPAHHHPPDAGHVDLIRRGAA